MADGDVYEEVPAVLSQVRTFSLANLNFPYTTEMSTPTATFSKSSNFPRRKDTETSAARVPTRPTPLTSGVQRIPRTGRGPMPIDSLSQLFPTATTAVVVTRSEQRTTSSTADVDVALVGLSGIIILIIIMIFT